MTTTSEQMAWQLREAGIVAIVRGDFGPDKLLPIVEALLSGGVRAIEVTLNTSDALGGIAAARHHAPSDVYIGAGTVRSAADVDRAVAAGAQYLIAPCLDLASLARAREHGVLMMPGVYTPTEAQTAYIAGCRTVKLFPADFGGPAYLKALRAPLDDIDFVPTGGVNVETIAAFRRAGAVAVGVGSALVSANATLEELSARAAALRKAWDAAA
ncbi:bifunctional 4-hydroxy-2-oxoglutarate aldolase/2-dehydro-3-deoxy-phosphogluconate aldolase [Candidatus Gracilibacteria bacterium]|nr:bifunctional 4-hydroxy-2-oxoglutarate aldolase/2-dehydro-3-deoxy-phosphogluconate aldolase [Candidatus Gracilibacteria bacterium]